MTSQDFTHRLTSNPHPVVVDVWAAWCTPCKWVSPIVERLGAEYAGRVEVWKVNADEQPEVVRGLGVIGIPTLIAFHAGQEITRRTGAAGESDLRAIFESARLGQRPARRPLPPAARLLRLTVGTAVLLLGVAREPSILLLAAGGLILFSAVADRCPIWQAIRPRLAALIGRHEPTASRGPGNV
jgi:thioredoxin